MSVTEMMLTIDATLRLNRWHQRDTKCLNVQMLCEKMVVINKISLSTNEAKLPQYKT